ncbi:MAG: MotA/TolQ/ExbB proton channel family protein [Acidaminococcaceae bacterium]|nr:MotA/TolQ/ExbB proton channel family protein [Acidaminococcaceae bacterium]
MSAFSTAADYFVKGGPCMWPLLFCSIGSIVIGVERYLYYRKSMSGTDYAVEFCKIINDFDYKGAGDLSRSVKGEAAKMALDALSIKENLGNRLESIIYARADRIIDSYERNINYLSVLIGLAPMLGLLGTITGMIASFNALNERTQNPMAVTAGIGEALITTVFGLTIAIMGMCIHAYLSSKIKTETLNIYEISSALVDLIQVRNEKV